MAVLPRDGVGMNRSNRRQFLSRATATLGLPVLALLSSGATFAEARAMREALAGPQVQIQTIECHHWPLTERPAEVRQAVEAWVGASFPLPPPQPAP